jgi:sugar/nucleoside kinase (ribokinase family)
LPDGEKKESYGGLLYSIVPLALLTEERTKIYPVLNLGADVEVPVKAILSRYPQISLEGVRVVPEKNNHALLRYRSEGERQEVLEGGVPPLTFAHIAPFLDADLLLVNFISGCDISLETLKQARASTSATIYLDVHSLSLGLDRRGRRFWRQIPNWREWVAQTDVVQVNRGEAELLSGGHVDSEGDMRSFGRAVIEAGASLLLITLGSEGSLMVVASERGGYLERFGPHSPPVVKDPTGCGDVFLSAFVVEHTRSGDSRKASRYANQVAGAKCGLSGIEELEALRALKA